MQQACFRPEYLRGFRLQTLVRFPATTGTTARQDNDVLTYNSVYRGRLALGGNRAIRLTAPRLTKR